MVKCIYLLPNCQSVMGSNSILKNNPKSEGTRTIVGSGLYKAQKDADKSLRHWLFNDWSDTEQETSNVEISGGMTVGWKYFGLGEAGIDMGSWDMETGATSVGGWVGLYGLTFGYSSKIINGFSDQYGNYVYREKEVWSISIYGWSIPKERFTYSNGFNTRYSSWEIKYTDINFYLEHLV